MNRKLNVDGVEIPVDREGYLKNLDHWSHDVAAAIADQEGISLSEQHWQIIHLLRNFYQRYQISPAMRALVKAVKREFGEEKGRSIYLMQLFPAGPAKQASKIAGLPKPDNCI